MRSSLSRPSVGTLGRLFAPITALLLAMLLVLPAIAASWGSALRINHSGSRVFDDLDLAVVNAQTAVAAYPEYNGVISELNVRRTTDGGASWGAPMLLSAPGANPSLAAYGDAVDLVFNIGDGSVWYTRSADRGASWSAATALSDAGRFAAFPEVAHGPDGVVAVIWEEAASRDVYVRVSHDNGATFAKPISLSTNAGTRRVAIAIGDGVIYAGYSSNSNVLKLRRSTDGGSTWSAPAPFKDVLRTEVFSIAASGQDAVVVYTMLGGKHEPVLYSRTTHDAGNNWSSRRQMTPGAWYSFDPDVAIGGGRVHAVFARCLSDLPANCRIMYTHSTDGLNWSSPERVSPKKMADAFSPHVGQLGKRLATIYIGVPKLKENAYIQLGS